MLRISGGPPGGEALATVVLVAYDPASGRVLGQFAHSSFGPAGEAELERSRRAFHSDLLRRLGESAEVEMIQLDRDRWDRGSITRVDPQTRLPVFGRPY